MAKGWYARNRDILDAMERGEMSLLDVAIDDFIRLKADYTTGLAWVSAQKIKSLCPRGIGITLRAIQRSLERLEACGRLKRYRTVGQHGNYPALCGHYFVRDSSLNWWRVNLEKTIDWRKIQYDPVTDPSDIGHSSVAHRSLDMSPTNRSAVAEPSPVKEKDLEPRFQNQDQRPKTECKDDVEYDDEYDSAEIPKKLPTEQNAEKIAAAFETWDIPPDRTLRIGPDLLATLFIDRNRMCQNEKTEQTTQNVQRAWAKAWRNIVDSSDLIEFINEAEKRAKKTKLWLDSVFFLRRGQLERGELDVRPA